MKRLLSILIVLAFYSCESKRETNTDQTIATTTEKVFPEDFLGIYKGDLQITSSNGTSQIPMEFHLTKTDTVDKFNYTIFYGKERDPRNYNLERTHNPNLFLVDENNGIILESAYADHTLYSTYEVMGNLLHSTEIFYEDRIEFMIAMARIQDTSTTGNEESAIVKNYPMSVLQKATLYKQIDSTRSK